MAVSINHNYDVDAQHAINVPVNQVNTSNFVVTVDTPGNTLVTNLTSPMGLEETVNYRVSKIPNIYQNSGIERNVRAPLVSGIRANVHIAQRWSLKDSENPDWDYVLPAFCDITLKIPNNPYISQNDIVSILTRSIGMLMDVDGSARIIPLMRGATNPKD